MNRLVAIVGPTGIGKSRVAIRLAQTFNGEIVSADSRQVYRYMDIGTAKPSRQEQTLVAHHLIDIANPDDDFSLAQYQELASRTIDDIQQKNKLALLVGGSGQYVWAMLEGWGIPQVPPDLEFRHSLAERAARDGADKLYRELAEIDPISAQKIDPRNVRRVIRALEIYRTTQTPPSHIQRKTPPPFDTLILGLTLDRSELYRRIDARVDEMIKQGLIEEVKRLRDMGYGFSLPAMSGIGYKQIGMFLRSELTLEDAIQQIKHETHRFVRHQYSWFRLKDGRIKWFNVRDEVDSEITALLAQFISKT